MRLHAPSPDLADAIADQSDKMPSSARRIGGFTLIELLVVVAIIAVLASMLLVVIGMVRFNARNTVCAGQLRQWGVALMADAVDHEGNWCSDQIHGGGGRNAHDFANDSYERLVTDYGMPTRILCCPHQVTSSTLANYEAFMASCKGLGFILLGYGYWVQRSDDGGGVFPPAAVACPTLIAAANPDQVPLMTDFMSRSNHASPLLGGHQQHENGPRSSNELYTDGHVSAVSNSAIVWRYDGNYENWR